MAISRIGATVCAVLGVAVGSLASEAPEVLCEKPRVGDATRVLVTLKAEGLYQPAPPPGASKGEASRPLALKVETRLDFAERVLGVDSGGRARRAVRRVVQAASAINGEIRPTGALLRPEVSLLVAESRPEGVVVFSPKGPLTRPELELVQGVGDPLALVALLPPEPVKVGERWRAGDDAAVALSGYDVLADNALQAVLQSVKDDVATIGLSGAVRGSVLGGDGTITFKGSLTFDGKAGRIDRVTLERTETRKPGPVEAGLDVKSTLTVTRRRIETPAVLGDDALAGVPLDADALREQLLLVASGGKYALRHGRDWHTYWDDARQTVLKRIDRGLVTAQCNLSMGPSAGKGRHQDLAQFRDDLRRALGKRFGEFLGEGEVEGDPAGGFRYKVGVQGREGEFGVVWYYYLVASPEGEQLLATFTLGEDQAKSFGEEDLRLIGSLRWRDVPAPKP